MFKKIALSIIFLLFCQNIFAQDLHGKFADWTVFTTGFGSKKICYAVSLPIKQSGNYRTRGEPYFLVINSADNIDEINISSGYVYKNASEAEISFGLKKFYGLTYKSLVWANNKNDDIDIIKEMRRNLDVVVSGVNRQNKYSSDTYSLIGFKQAFGKMKEICSFNLKTD
ncbi:MAG: hypothetical protein ACJAZX_001399 [Rickettsiales bacterium]|jgi:hypothetical protein